MPIVSDLQQLEPSIFDQYLNCSGARINRILKELFQRVYRSDNNFSGSYFVDNILIKSLIEISRQPTYLRGMACLDAARRLRGQASFISCSLCPSRLTVDIHCIRHSEQS